MPTVNDCRILDFPRIHDLRGSLTPIENLRHIPFEARRVSTLYDVPGGGMRNGHAHERLQQVLIAVSGSFDVHVDDGGDRRTFHLNRPYQGLYLPPMIWREMDNFTTNALCIVLASEPYDATEYLRDYDAFVRRADHARDASSSSQ